MKLSSFPGDTMTIEQELTTCAVSCLSEKRSKTRISNAARMSEMVLHYYGFRDTSWPSLEATGHAFSTETATLSRERIRQVIYEFRCLSALDSLPGLREFATILDALDSTSSTGLKEILAARGLIESDCNMAGLLNLLHDFGLCRDREIYTPGLKRAGHVSYAACEETFIFSEARAAEYQGFLKEAKKLPGLLGIARFSQLKQKVSGINDPQSSLLKEIIRAHTEAWILEDGDDFWYTFEDRENTLYNFNRKVFSVIDSCDSKTLAAAYWNGLFRRSSKLGYPTEEVIAQYLETCRHLTTQDGALVFLGSPLELANIDKDAVAFLKGKDFVLFPEFKKYLTGKGYTAVNSNKAIFNSPLVLVDRADGRYHYKFRLVTCASQKAGSEDPEEIRLNEYRKRLKVFESEGTDEPVEVRHRKEHSILKEWLFRDKEEEECAICNRRFSVDALVCAHKKPRRDCSELERTDPHLVFPVCLMGCDFLYEKRYIYVDEAGVIRTNPDKNGETADYLQAAALVGRAVNKKWLRGSERYFWRPK